MKTLYKLKLTGKQKRLIDNLIRNAYAQGHQDGFGVSGKHFNGISGMLKSTEFNELTITEADKYMAANEELFRNYYTIKEK
jgi:hypothetical protein